ncbi:hypothetical protein ACFYTS_15445 [Nocardia sp. NPDC004151]|uniref:hypothetical protein n=1 Tax=Nocardia sp. NPDC004151 TaxID=3364304 RepID=UPI0036ACFA38
MPKIRFSNTSDKLLRVWTEPIPEDYWMRPGDVFTIAYDDDDYAESVIGDAHFDVSWNDEGVTVWLGTCAFPDVYDQSGNRLECGHQRPKST